MSNFISGSGIFDFFDSDRHVGSYFKKSDIFAIFGFSDSDFLDVPIYKLNNFEVIDEKDLMKFWYNFNSSKKVSMDELILIKLINLVYPEAIITTQEKVGRFSLDLKVSVNGVEKYIEFDGPSHFALTKYGPPRVHPFYKKYKIEDITGIEVVNWPYWIQRCETNVKSIFDKTKNGYGALWSTNIHFGDFYFNDSAEIIKNISLRFGAFGDDGVCNYYEENSLGRVKPEHPIIKRILKGKDEISRIIPKGYIDFENWVPLILR